MRTPLVIGNWKMNLTACEAEALAKALIEPLSAVKGVEYAICPAFPFLTDVVRAVTGTKLQVGAQDISWEDKGAFTGEVSPTMIASLVRFVILGHSERRQKLGETDGMVNWKVLAAIRHAITPIVCVGEDLKTREAGKTDEFLRSQVEAALKTVEEHALDDFVIAYEPIWAIGTGKNASPDDAEAGCGFIRSIIRELYNEPAPNHSLRSGTGQAAERVRILYGGSVNASNAKALAAGMNIDGFLVGGASLQVQEFVGIAKAMAG